MLPSQELRQQQSEALKIAEEQKAPKKRAASPVSSTPTTDARAPDLTGGVEVEGLRFPANVMMANSSSNLSVGNHYSNQMSTSGVVKRLVLMPGGYCLAAVETATGTRWVAVMPSGMTAELVP